MLGDLRADFPLLNRDGRIAFLDSAASSQKPQSVLDAMHDAYTTYYANVHRGAYELSARSTDAYEAARRKVADFIGADPQEVVFTRGTTTSLNMLAFAWAQPRLGPGDRIVLTHMEHHANLIPWQMIAKRTGAELVFAPLDDHLDLDLDAFASLIDARVKVVSVTGMSNVLGTIPSISQIREALAGAPESVLVVDAAQLVAHAPIDVSTLGADFLAFSSHKMLGPTGIGVLWGRLTLLDEMEPFEGGGEMIEDVGLYESTWAPVPQKFEAGTPPIVEAIGLGAAVDYLAKVGMTAVRAHDMELTAYGLERLRSIDGVRVFGPENVERRGGVLAFTMGGVHPHDLATVLDSHGVSIRAGHHCARPLMHHLGVPATARASFSVYSTPEDVDMLVDGLEAAAHLFDV